MKLATMLGDVMQSLVRKPITERYPFERKEAPANLRGRVEYDSTKCTGCMLCVKDCPSKALELIVVDKANKRFVMRYHLDRCTYCAQCVETCRFGSLSMSNVNWELAALTREPFAILMGKKEDVDVVLERDAAALPSQPSKTAV
jgi:formate hydrogenlyase subunit 6/NADH:ubiquinone oxidoreductase subunit I